MEDIKVILATALEHEASDVHINVGLPPIMRINTELVEIDLPPITNEEAKHMLSSMISEDKFKVFEEKRDFDFSTKIDDGTRFRVNAHYQKNSIAMSFRIISSNIPNLEDLGLPAIVQELTELPRGLILVTGPTGSGKSTSLASMVNAINRKYGKRIITLEDPVEYMFENDCSMIEQREIGSDCTSFASGLRHALRQDPDILLVGEMRDLETASSTITAAETGHLVFSTLHTINASQTIERIIDIYPSTQQNQIRAMLSNTLQAVISQTLFKRIDQKGMIPCTEILLCTPAVRNCIRENRIHEIPNIMETSRRLGMHKMDDSIANVCIAGCIDKQEAIIRSSNPSKMAKLLANVPDTVIEAENEIENEITELTEESADIDQQANGVEAVTCEEF